MKQDWHNAPQWSNDIPINFLPFYVWCKTLNVEPLYNFDDKFNQFMIDLELDIPDNHVKKFKQWCSEQFTHYYECSH